MISFTTAKTFLLILSAASELFFAIGISMLIFGQSFLHGIVDFSSNVSFSNESSFFMNSTHSNQSISVEVPGVSVELSTLSIKDIPRILSHMPRVLKHLLQVSYSLLTVLNHLLIVLKETQIVLEYP